MLKYRDLRIGSALASENFPLQTKQSVSWPTNNLLISLYKTEVTIE